MNALLITLLLQSFFMPPRLALTNPALVSPVPKNIKKDYDKLWTQFLTAKQDPKIIKDSAKLLKKQKDAQAVITLQAYVDLYAGRRDEAERKLETVLAAAPNHRIALSYLADLAFAREDYAKAADLYTRLLAVDNTRTDVEPKRQKAILLGAEALLRNAARAEQENRLSDAERLYRDALRIAPNQSTLNAELGELLLKEQKWDEAVVQFRRQMELDGANDEAQRHLAEALMKLGRTEEARGILDRLRESGGPDEALEAQVKDLEDLGRWGGDISQFRQIEDSHNLTREQLAAMIVRYFPQLAEFRQTPQIVTDVQNSWASLEIQTVVGLALMDPLPNHTFQPSKTITRGELAQTLSRLSRILGLIPRPAPPIPTSDLAPSHALYPDVQLALGFGALMLDDAGNFDVSGSVSGEQAVNAVGRLLALLKEKTG